MASRVDSPRQTIRGRLIKYILPAVALVLLASIGTAIWLSRTAQERLAFARAQETARAVASDVGREIYANHKLGEVLAVQMENNRTANRAEVMDQLRQLLAENPDLLGTYVGYEPNAFDGKDAEFVSQPGHDATGRFLPYWNKLTGKTTLDPIVDMDKSEFYTLPKSTKTWTVLEPYLYEGVLLASFISPIVRDDQFLGIAGVDVSLEQLDQRIRAISVFETGRALMVGKTGLLIGGGEKADVGKKKLTDLSGDADQKVLAEIVRAIGAGKAGSAKVAALGSIRDAVLFYQPIATAGWGLITVVPSKEIYAPVTFLTRAQASIGLGALLLVAALISVLAGRLTRPITLLDKAAQGAAAGNLQAVAGIKSGDEVESLANSFNKMIESVTSKSAVEAESEKLQREILAFLSLMASASQGDFTVRAKVTDSVVGNVADSLNLMLGDVGVALRNAQDTSTAVAHSAREIRGDAEALAAGASAQEQAIDSTRAVVGNLTKSLEDVSASARSAADSAARVESASSEGGGAVREVVEGMTRIRQNVVASAKRVKRLGERSMEVSSITTTIAEISAQTNMLALNASMEAARAGEQGRGFAVVADEVRKLAARAAQATKDIEALVGGIQDEVNTVSGAMEAQTSDVERESRIVATAGEALTRIGEAAHQASQQVANISNLSQSQAQNAAEVLAAMNAVVDIARRARTSSDRSLSTAESLANLANELTDRLRRFRTPEGSGAS